MSNILITGGAGFIGSHTIRALLSRGERVVCVDDFNNFYSPEIKEKNVRDFLNSKNFKLYRVDICDLEKLKKVFLENKIDLIIHLAARAGVRPSIQNPILYTEVNIDSTLNLLELARQFKIKKFIFASSSSVYGNNKKTLFSENDNVDNPISPYAATKKAGELMCYTYHDLYKMSIACLRFFTVYGPSGRPDMAPYKFTDLIYKDKEIPMYGDGTSRRDYTFVDDIVSGILSATEYVKSHGCYEIFNLGNSNTVELIYFISVIEKLLNKKAKILKLPKQPGDVEVTFADISKAKKLLGYGPKVKIEEGMERFIEWYKENRK
jgi:UDP-glucuronate 4-epimerase